MTNAVQSHGFSWEREIRLRVYRAIPEELETLKQNSKFDLPSHFNHLDGHNLSVKTTHTQRIVCMGDCLRIFDAASNGESFHMVVIQYTQNDTTKTKHICSIVEVDLTSSKEILFGDVSRAQLKELDSAVKSVPQSRRPTTDEHDRMYSLRNAIQPSSNAIHMDIKCNGTQSRLQCSLNRFHLFLEQNPNRIVARSNTNEFRGNVLTPYISSARRSFKAKPSVE